MMYTDFIPERFTIAVGINGVPCLELDELTEYLDCTSILVMKYHVFFDWVGFPDTKVYVKARMDGVIKRVTLRGGYAPLSTTPSSKTGKEACNFLKGQNLRLWYPERSFRRYYYLSMERCRLDRMET